MNWFRFTKAAFVMFPMLGLVMLAGASLAQTLSPDQTNLVADFNGMAGSLQASSTAFDHMKAELKSVIEAQQKEAAELAYWRQYFAGLPAAPAAPKPPEVKQLPPSVAPK